jgi:hypothetical protein
MLINNDIYIHGEFVNLHIFLSNDKWIGKYGVYGVLRCLDAMGLNALPRERILALSLMLMKGQYFWRFIYVSTTCSKMPTMLFIQILHSHQWSIYLWCFFFHNMITGPRNMKTGTSEDQNYTNLLVSSD